MSKRGERRRRTKNIHRSRIKKWFYWEHSDRVGSEEEGFASHIKDFEEFVAHTRWLGVHKKTAKPCSCQMCRNPRRTYWGDVTLQEKKAAMNCREQLEELYDEGKNFNLRGQPRAA
jgi:hypothetical protein